MATDDWWSRRLSRTVDPPSPPSPFSSARLSVPGTGDDTMARVAEAAMRTGGSERVKQNSGRCPECGSGNYFARRYSEQGSPLRMEASPRCFDCGYPIVQAGSSHGGASHARSDGSTTRARQLPAGHTVTVVVPGGGTMSYPVGNK